MILAVDVAYLARTAWAAGVLFHDWNSDAISSTVVVEVDDVADYIPGSFYLRELPCIEKLLKRVKQPIRYIVIDGYVTLGESDAPGLGMRLWESIHRSIPVIGVAKSEFAGTPEIGKLYRGNSSRPLFISAIGMPIEDAKRYILTMKGAHRLPDFLKAVDRLCREHAGEAGAAQFS
jgi:deoxyribonuclease V